MNLDAIKSAARTAAFERRRGAHGRGLDGAAQARLQALLAAHQGKSVAGYMPMRTEINPLPVMAHMATFGPVCVPVIQAKAQPLVFKTWTPGCALEPGPFGASVPVTGSLIEPDVLIVPLVAFDRNGGRLGYGGGFYDRTLDLLRSRRPTVAIGFAFGAQEAESLPLEATDQPLDAIVTEAFTLTF